MKIGGTWCLYKTAPSVTAGLPQPLRSFQHATCLLNFKEGAAFDKEPRHFPGVFVHAVPLIVTHDTQFRASVQNQRYFKAKHNWYHTFNSISSTSWTEHSFNLAEVKRREQQQQQKSAKYLQTSASVTYSEVWHRNPAFSLTCFVVVVVVVLGGWYYSSWAMCFWKRKEKSLYMRSFLRTNTKQTNRKIKLK